MSDNNNGRRPASDLGSTPRHRAQYPLTAERPAAMAPRYRVIPAGKAFYHVVETSTNRVIGYRRQHIDACTLARQLESGE